MDGNNLKSTGAVVAALKDLQEKMWCLERERKQSIEEVHSLRTDLARRHEDLKYTQEVQILTEQDQANAVRLSHEQLLADKRTVDLRLEETEASVLNRIDRVEENLAPSVDTGTPEIIQDLKNTCKNARDRAQGAHVSQWAAEAKLSVLDRRIEEIEKRVRTRDEISLRARKNVRQKTAETGAELDALSAQVEKLERAMKEEHSSRKAAERRCRQARDTSSRISRYLDNILRVNEELVMRTTKRSIPPRSAGQRPTPRQGRGGQDKPERANGPKNSPLGRREGGILGELHLGAAVEDALRAGWARGDPVHFLEALYERIGFSVMQREGEASGTHSLPTSPSRDRERDKGREKDRERMISQVEGEGPYNVKPVVSGGDNGFFLRECMDRNFLAGAQPASQLKEIKRTVRDEDGVGNRIREGRSPGKPRYSFGRSPHRRAVSSAEGSPMMLRRLEDLVTQLERERVDVERGYKTVVQRASSSAYWGVEDPDLNFRSLTRAIAYLQRKNEQLEVAKESLRALKEVPHTQVYSPMAHRRESAALHVLQRLRQDGRRGVGESRAGLAAA